MTMALSACEEEPAQSSSGSEGGGAPSTTPAATTSATTADPDDNAGTDKEAKEVSTADYQPDGNAGTIKYLGYFDLSQDQKSSEQYLVFTSELYGGTIDYNATASGDAYFEKLASLISADDSPDILSYEWQSFPGGISKNVYQPLDEYIDLEAPLWSGIKDVVENFSYEGKHYYYPHKIKTNFAINYDRKTIEESNLKDPYDLYKEGNWTWDTFRELMTSFCNLSEDNIGFCSTGDVISAFISTCGTPLIDVLPDGSINNNISDPNVSRAMSFIEGLYRDGLMYNKQLGDWVAPALWAVNSSQVLFLGMEPEWAYIAATEKIQNPNGVDNDIFDTVSDYAFVPFPRDPSADKYYAPYDTYGYLVARGAKNIKGAVDWIYCNRVYETDENVIAQAREDAIHPAKVLYTEGKNEGKQKWQITWDENVYDIWKEMTNPEKFEFIFDDAYGFNSTLTSTISSNMLNEVAYNGGSWTQLSAENSPAIDAILDEYRK